MKSVVGQPFARRQALRALVLPAVAMAACQLQAAPVVLPSAESLQASLSGAIEHKQPLVVMVSLHRCPFCKVVRENYLQPLRETGLQVVQIDMRDPKPLLDFDGTSTTHDTWTRKMGMKIAPTVMFFGPQGREVAARLTGAYLPDFYGSYLDEQLAVARRTIATIK